MVQVIRCDAGVEPPSIGIGACGWVASEREVERVRRNERIASATQVGVNARPAKVLRFIDHGGAYRVELDVAHNRQQVALALHEAGFEPSLPKRPASVMPEVEGLDVRLADPPHGFRERSDGCRCDQQMEVVVHQDECMKCDGLVAKGPA